MNLQINDLLIFKSVIYRVSDVVDDWISIVSVVVTGESITLPKTLFETMDLTQVVVVRQSTGDIAYHDPLIVELGWRQTDTDQSPVAWLCNQLASLCEQLEQQRALPEPPEVPDPVLTAIQLLAADNWILSAKVGMHTVLNELMGDRITRLRGATSLLLKELKRICPN